MAGNGGLLSSLCLNCAMEVRGGTGMEACAAQPGMDLLSFEGQWVDQAGRAKEQYRDVLCLPGRFAGYALWPTEWSASE
jgi:hypothetical protein